MKTKLIGISGKLRHGKDTLADFIKGELSDYVKQKNYNTYYNQCGEIMVKVSFSDPIKEAVQKIFPDLKKEDLWGPSQNRSKVIEGYIDPRTGDPLTVRDCLTTIGAWGRSCNENCWADATIKKAARLIKLNRYVIVSDCRYKNEKKAIEDAGGIVIRVVRPDVGFTTNDPSEIDLDDVTFDNVVINDSVETLRFAASKIVSNFLL